MRAAVVCAAALIAAGASLAAVVRRTAPAAPVLPPKRIAALVRTARSAELAALKALGAGNTAKAADGVKSSLDDLKTAQASAAQLADFGEVNTDLKQALATDEAAVGALGSKPEVVNGRAGRLINSAINKKEAALQAIGEEQVAITPPKPTEKLPPPPPATEPQPPTVPQGVFDGLKAYDDHLQRVIDQLKAEKVDYKAVYDELRRLQKEKYAILDLFPSVYGRVTMRDLASYLEWIDYELNYAATDLWWGGKENAARDVGYAKFYKASLERQLSGPVIEEDDTWAHNLDLKKSVICINVRTNPPQASATVEIFGPNGYHSRSPDKTPLIKGARQFTSPITVAGDYTKTITVYDASGTETGFRSKTFTVAYPDNGPASKPPCAAPTG